jgi:hypothetical protein
MKTEDAHRRARELLDNILPSPTRGPVAWANDEIGDLPRWNPERNRWERRSTATVAALLSLGELFRGAPYEPMSLAGCLRHGELWVPERCRDYLRGIARGTVDPMDVGIFDAFTGAVPAWITDSLLCAAAVSLGGGGVGRTARVGRMIARLRHDQRRVEVEATWRLGGRSGIMRAWGTPSQRELARGAGPNHQGWGGLVVARPVEG